jgi:hypothetical protein
MIVKEADPLRCDSLRARTGAKAERDMAFYLRRAFGDCDDVYVFNDLRLEHGGEVAQIDHLILHRHGFFIIESKSVSGEILILPDGQFIRHSGPRRAAGMPSPIEQAKRQRDLLRKLLQANKTLLRDRKLLGMIQGGFTHCPIEIRVAISDNGIIRGQRHAKEVRKADLIAGEIEQRVEEHRRGSKLLNLNAKPDEGIYRFTDIELQRVREFLLAQHRPMQPGEAAPEPEREAVSPQEHDAGRASASAPAVHAGRDSGAPRPAASDRPAADAVDHASAGSARSPSAKGAVGEAEHPPQYLCSKCQSLKLRI